MTARFSFTNFDCVLEYAARKRVLFISYLKGSTLIHRCCLRVTSKTLATGFITGFGEALAIEIFKTSTPII